MVLLTPQEERLLRRVAATVRQRGLRGLAVFSLQAGRPLTLVAGQLLWIGQPALSLLWPARQIATLAELLEQPGATDLLLDYLNADE
ncbi:MAG: hypothetical protein RRC07_07475 [Anaerolineae bacterium]|nr:hypothetical protein [Anaerolineae bacterium]